MYKIEDYTEPQEHPYKMLEDCSQAFEKEKMLVFMITKCIEANDIDHVVETKFNHPTMVTDGLMEVCGDAYHYKLTEKSKKLLFKYYGKK